ncbi:hypothetical protein EJ07DRAFT_94512, partial [Lizonia empirigonia]
GPHSSHTANQADPRVDSDRYDTAGNTAVHHGSDPTGPHDSKLANKLDPRVDSDKVGPTGNSSSIGGYDNEHHTSGQQTYQTDGKKLPEALLEDHSRADHHSGAGLSHTHGSDPTGPHDSHLANKADPRVDSDRYGAAGNTSGAGGYGAGQYGTTGSGLTGSHGTHGSTGYGTTGSGLTGNQGYSDPTGPHDSHLSNKADPRVDSDRYGGQGNTYGTTQSSGFTGNNHPGQVGNPNANQTAGPHGSNILNKLDPRVDSDLDGSKRVGGDRTYG